MRTVLAMAVAVALAAGTLSVASGADDKKLTPTRLAVVPQGRHAAPAVSPAAFNEVLLGFLKDN